MQHKVKFLPSGREVSVPEGASVYDAAISAGLPLRAECGGRGVCGRCVVKIESGPCTPVPHAALSEAQQRKGYRLACRASVAGDLSVYIPEESLVPAAGIDFETVVLSEDDAKRRRILGETRPSPPLELHSLEMPPPTPADNLSDFERLCRALRRAGVDGEVQCALPLLKRIPEALREGEWRVAATLFREGGRPELVAIRGAPGGGLHGLALDLGTTTVVAELVDLATGECRHRAAAYNRQISCGADIISRIVAASRPGGVDKLRALALETIQALLDRLFLQTGLSPGDIAMAAVAGNTTMAHLLLGLPAEQIRREPYIPVLNRYPFFTAADIGLNIAPAAPVFFAPAVGSYVGGDVLAGILACRMHLTDELTLFIDAGTNGEIVLGNREWMIGCACSTGPAFEGIGIGCGMMAAAGAVESVGLESPDAPPSIGTIGGAPPRGICGSGMIDLMAQLFLNGLVDRRGVLSAAGGGGRIESREGHAAYLLRRAGEAGAAKEIYLTNVDLKKLLLTKAAIQAAILTLFACAEVKAEAVGRVVVAGRLGEAIDAANAIALGMLPSLPGERFEYIGNGSLWGANLLLLSKEARREILSLADRITYLDLSTHPRYMDEFIASLFIPHTNAPGI